MRKGLSLAEFLIALTILALIATPVTAYFYTTIQKTFAEQKTQQHYAQLNLALDTICNDIQEAKTVIVYPHSITIMREHDTYSYILAKNRLAKQRESIMYITPNDMLISTFACQKQNNHITIQLTTTLGPITRICVPL